MDIEVEGEKSEEETKVEEEEGEGGTAKEDSVLGRTFKQPIHDGIKINFLVVIGHFCKG